MKIFPFFFGFISFNMPAGLVVYFAASQIFRIGQQALILRMDDKRKSEEATASGPKGETEKPKPSAPPKPTPRPAAQRRPQGSKKRGKKRRRR